MYSARQLRDLWQYTLMGIAVCLLVLNTDPVSAADQTKALMHHPDIHDDLAVFVYGGDIWSVPAQGGVAQRLTIHDGNERYPRFSPDGSRIAFTAQYDGNADVYVMNPHGGKITRVTYHPGNDHVIGWHPTKKKILFRSARHSYNRFTQLYLISPDGTGLEELVMHEAANGSFSPGGNRIAYNRVARAQRTWKRYGGGLAQELYLLDFETNEETQITQFRRTDRFPMWMGEKIYFNSDRNHRLNLYSYDLQSDTVRQLTSHTEYDVRYPDNGSGKIIYQYGATLRVYDTSTGQDREIPVEIRTDTPGPRPYLKEVKEDVTDDFDVSPGGERALVVARGEVFTVPREHGPIRNLTGSSGARDRTAVWSPDGQQIAYISDQSGEYEIHVIDPQGETESVKLTEHNSGYRHSLEWSPDNRKIAFTDQTLRLYVLDTETGNITTVDKANYENVDVAQDDKPISDYAWSPDSKWLAYSKMDSSLMYQVYLYSLESGEIHKISNGLFHDFGPEFSRDGDHLFYISNRRFSPTLGDFEWEMVYKDVAGIYAVTLRADGEPFLPLRSDEVEEGAERGEEMNDDSGDEVTVEVDTAGISNRIEDLPLPRGNYRELSAGNDALYYLNKEEGDFNKFQFREVGPMDLYAFSFQGRDEHLVINSINGYRLSADGSAIVYRKNTDIGIIDATAERSSGESLDLSDLTMWLNPREEWEQILHEAWRMERDYYYEADMHGLDWDSVREKYTTLLPYAADREDVGYLIGEMIGELNTSHTYVWGGDEKRQAEGINVGMLGVDWKVDAENNRYRFSRIYTQPDWTDEVDPPLAGPGIEVEQGDYLLAVNGKNVTADRNIYSYFQNLAGKQVTLTVNSEPTPKGAEEYRVKPLRGEYTLRYNTWVEQNRELVEKKSNGKIGYLHLPDTYLGSQKEFPKYFYSQTRKQGLIIDGRYNGGGLDPDIFLRRLDRPVHAFWTRRYSHDQTIPEVATRAHMVCLTNKQAGSGGDMLPFEFRSREMGPIIGTRTWGGLVGVSQWIEMVDGGSISAPDYRIYNKQGDWIIENEGVKPDIVVENHPKEMAQGEDAQLTKAIEVLMEQIRENPVTWPEHKPYPEQSW